MTAEGNLPSATIQSVNSIREGKLSVEADKDKQYFFEDNHASLVQPLTFAYLPYNDEEVGLLLSKIIIAPLGLQIIVSFKDGASFCHCALYSFANKLQFSLMLLSTSPFTDTVCGTTSQQKLS